jgi:hypothetical protein
MQHAWTTEMAVVLLCRPDSLCPFIDIAICQVPIFGSLHEKQLSMWKKNLARNNSKQW